MFIDMDEIRRLRERYYLQMQESGIKTFQDMDRTETEALESGDHKKNTKNLSPWVSVNQKPAMDELNLMSTVLLA